MSTSITGKYDYSDGALMLTGMENNTTTAEDQPDVKKFLFFKKKPDEAKPEKREVNLISMPDIPVAVSPVAMDSDEYNMNHLERGPAVIFNNVNFNKETLGQRAGSHVDVKNLIPVLKLLGFKPYEHLDFTREQIEDEIVRLSQLDYKNSDCLLIIILTHGDDFDMLYAKDVPYDFNDIANEFTPEKCPSLAGKPKIYLVQACKGGKVDKGVFMRMDGNGNSGYSLPSSADTLIVFSTNDGDVAWLNPNTGSPFISYFCETVREKFETTDFGKIMQLVSRKVAINFKSNTAKPETNEAKQMPMIKSTLIRDIYFKPKRNK